jgi:hypothetical protein
MPRQGYSSGLMNSYQDMQRQQQLAAQGRRGPGPGQSSSRRTKVMDHWGESLAQKQDQMRQYLQAAQARRRGGR